MRIWLYTLAGVVCAQTPVISLNDALARARQYGGQIQGANLAALQAKEDRAQAWANTLPSVNAFNQFIYTEGNGTPSGVFVANDGVHIYNEQAVVHQDLLALARHGEIRRAMAAEAIARAKVEVAVRGVTATVIQDYFGILLAQRKLANFKLITSYSEQFVELTQKQETGGEVAHADVLKAQIDLEQRQRDVKEALLGIDKAKIALGVLIFPSFTSDFSIVDDFYLLQPHNIKPSEKPTPEAVEAARTSGSPEIKAAQAGVQEAEWETRVARYQFLPTFGLDFYYGIDANQFAATTSGLTDATGRSTLPNYQVSGRQNLGYSAQVTVNIPVWNWGATRSKVKQAELKRDQAQLDLSLAQRTVQSNLVLAQMEFEAAEGQLQSLYHSMELTGDSLRLTLLRYQAGEATAFEAVDARNTYLQALNARDEGLARWRMALANLRMLTGSL